ncbi:hypothetical protein Landi51_11386 [Colletotrichum acutatum]
MTFSYVPHWKEKIGAYSDSRPHVVQSEEEYSVNGETMWSLKPGSNAETSWFQLEKTIDSFIAVTPVDEYHFTPKIVAEAYEMGREKNKTQPTVLISCSSQSYGNEMAKTLRRSGVLETHSTTFRVLVRP